MTSSFQETVLTFADAFCGPAHRFFMNNGLLPLPSAHISVTIVSCIYNLLFTLVIIILPVIWRIPHHAQLLYSELRRYPRRRMLSSLLSLPKHKRLQALQELLTEVDDRPTSRWKETPAEHFLRKHVHSFVFRYKYEALRRIKSAKDQQAEILLLAYLNVGRLGSRTTPELSKHVQKVLADWDTLHTSNADSHQEKRAQIRNTTVTARQLAARQLAALQRKASCQQWNLFHRSRQPALINFLDEWTLDIVKNSSIAMMHPDEGPSIDQLRVLVRNERLGFGDQHTSVMHFWNLASTIIHYILLAWSFLSWRRQLWELGSHEALADEAAFIGNAGNEAEVLQSQFLCRVIILGITFLGLMHKLGAS